MEGLINENKKRSEVHRKTLQFPFNLITSSNNSRN